MVLSAVGFVASCQRSTPIEAGFRESRLLVGNGIEPSSLDPHTNTGSAESSIISALFDPLIDWNDTATGFVPAAAERWTVSPDGLVYTFYLRKDARWSNGDAVTAQDWLLSLRRFVKPSVAAELAYMAYDVVGVEDFNQGRSADPTALGFAAPDDHTLVLTLRAPNADFLGRLTAYPWLPLHIPSVTAAGGMARPDSDFTRPGKLISNGAYRLTAWLPNQYVEVTRNPYFRTPPGIESLRFFPLESLDTEERAYRSGQLHITSGIPAHKIEGYREADDPALHVTSRVGIRYLITNVRRAPFDDGRVRRALALAIDRKQLAEAVLRTGEAPAYAFIGPIHGGYTPTALLDESIAEARRLLAAAGYPDGQGFPAVEYLYNSNDRNRDVAEALQQMWRSALNITVTLRNEEWKVFLDSRNRGDFQLARSGWLPWTPEPIGLYEQVVSDSGTNDTGWGNARFDALFWEARRTLDSAPRYALYQQMDEILRDEMPVIPLAYYSVARLVHPRVRGWPDNPLEAFTWRSIRFGEMP